MFSDLRLKTISCYIPNNDISTEPCSLGQAALNAEVAMVCGIDVRRIYLITSGLGVALAVAGGALVSIQFGFNPETGVVYTLQAFTIIILGGRGHYVGALIGGLMLAVLENLVSLMVPNGTAMVELAAYGLMISVLLIRPGGLMGVREP